MDPNWLTDSERIFFFLNQKTKTQTQLKQKKKKRIFFKKNYAACRLNILY